MVFNYSKGFTTLLNSSVNCFPFQVSFSTSTDALRILPLLSSVWYEGVVFRCCAIVPGRLSPDAADKAEYKTRILLFSGAANIRRLDLAVFT